MFYLYVPRWIGSGSRVILGRVVAEIQEFKFEENGKLSVFVLFLEIVLMVSSEIFLLVPAEIHRSKLEICSPLSEFTFLLEIVLMLPAMMASPWLF